MGRQKKEIALWAYLSFSHPGEELSEEEIMFK